MTDHATRLRQKLSCCMEDKKKETKKKKKHDDVAGNTDTGFTGRNSCNRGFFFPSLRGPRFSTPRETVPIPNGNIEKLLLKVPLSLLFFSFFLRLFAVYEKNQDGKREREKKREKLSLIPSISSGFNPTLNLNLFQGPHRP